MSWSSYPRSGVISGDTAGAGLLQPASPTYLESTNRREGSAMSWMNDKLSFLKGQSHKAQPAAVSCYSNQKLHAEITEDAAMSKIREAACAKMISELYLSQCEEALKVENPAYLTPQQQGAKLLQATKIKALRRTWQTEVA